MFHRGDCLKLGRLSSRIMTSNELLDLQSNVRVMTTQAMYLYGVFLSLIVLPVNHFSFAAVFVVVRNVN